MDARTTSDNGVELLGISKSFPGGTVANAQIDCSAYAGEIHAVLGENGAGKTTLMKILAGLVIPDSGVIRLFGEEMRFRSPKQAAAAGIAMVHQHFSLVEALTVAENLALGASEVGAVFSARAWGRRLRGTAEALGFDLRFDAPVWTLSMGERQRVEIFRLFLRRARVLILDEPTSILAPQEAQRLFAQLRELADAGNVVLLVTHKIQHALSVADRVTILRRGHVVASHPSAELDMNAVARLMVGQSGWRGATPIARNPLPSNDRILEVENLSVPPTTSPFGAREVSLEVRSGEILGVAGISGHGQDELVKGIVGLCRLSSGRIGLLTTRRAYVPEERLGVALVSGLSLGDNLALRNYRRRGFRRGPFLDRSALATRARETIKRLGITPEDSEAAIESLSGGNRQKAILGRELEGSPRLIVAQAPTAGLDFATVEAVHLELTTRAAAGAALLVISEDLDELLALCHRVVVMHEGRVVGSFEALEEQRVAIGLAMSGILPDESAPAVREAVC